MSIAQNVLLPIVLLILIGILWQKIHPVPLKPLTHLVLYVMAPILTLVSLVRSTVDGTEAIGIAVFVLVSTMAVAAISGAAARVLGYQGASHRALLMTTLFRNTGNYGFPIVLFTFGQAGLDRAIIFNVVEGVLLGTLAVFIAASGKRNLTESLVSVAKFPILHATVVAVLMNVMGLNLPDQIYTPLKMLGDATIPVALVLLGAQLAITSLAANPSLIGVAVFIRLLAAPAAGALVVVALSMDDLAGKVSLTLSAMPTAVLASVLAAEFDSEPEVVASGVLASTVLSVVTLELILGLVAS